jgi:hypothetical protein
MASLSLRVGFVEVPHVAAYSPFIGRPLWNALFAEMQKGVRRPRSSLSSTRRASS